MLTDVLCVFLVAPRMGIATAGGSALLEIDAVMLAGLVLLWRLGRGAPLGCAALGMLVYWATQIYAFGVGALSAELFTLELIIKLVVSGAVLRSITTAMFAADRLRAQGIKITAPMELPAARVRP